MKSSIQLRNNAFRASTYRKRIVRSFHCNAVASFSSLLLRAAENLTVYSVSAKNSIITFKFLSLEIEIMADCYTLATALFSRRHTGSIIKA